MLRPGRSLFSSEGAFFSIQSFLHWQQARSRTCSVENGIMTLTQRRGETQSLVDEPDFTM